MNYSHLEKNEILLSKAISTHSDNLDALRWYVRVACEDFPGRAPRICEHAIGSMIHFGPDNLHVLVGALINAGEEMPPNVLWLMCKEGFLTGEVAPQVVELMARILNSDKPVSLYEVEATFHVAQIVGCNEVVSLLSEYMDAQCEKQRETIFNALSSKQLKSNLRRKM
ncbi:hypothetical protein N7676_08965 [Stenotrophomonas sp. GD03993]|uniref:hypothetical protein n=1 Tax=unclassified Stenotrophomonas TaxID=196198 RepID=UPI00244A81BC|nr:MULTISPECIES: hypothetical protein [unclassified Stenotrophomonas]MDH0190157.1 hypothetical protein [Stenotrophomonas sp. GD04051]MDH0463937.1 hypothetical protein [Stenotrophomonas sp. GD03993]MDH0874559.1 hypothetical protein [Stenotrophomonas sp. GD03877]MDH2155156.1 hypothetical protein [Stenotrophomonas sp. GD03657]